MQHFLLAHSENKDWSGALDQCLDQLGNIPAGATLGFVYASDYHAAHLGDILRRLKEATGVPHWAGTLGMAVCCTRHEFYDQPAIVLLLTDIAADAFHMLDAHDALPVLPAREGVRVAVVHGDPRNGQAPKLIQQLPDQIGNGYLVGGLTSSNSYHYQIADEICEGSLSGVIFDDRVKLLSGLTQGCTPLGTMHQLTEADGNIAIRIDDRPALDVMKEDIGEILARDLNRIGGYIFAGFPVAESDTGDYLVRNLLGIDPDAGALAIGEYLQADSPIMFCKRDSKTAVDDLQRMVEKLKSRARSTIKGGLYFTCLGRGQHMFGEPGREMQLIAEVLGDVPIAGFYANGEIAGNRLYGYTGVLTLFLA